MDGLSVCPVWQQNNTQAICVAEELDEAQKQAKKSAEDTKQLQTQLNDAQKNTKEKVDYISQLQGRCLTFCF